MLKLANVKIQPRKYQIEAVEEYEKALAKKEHGGIFYHATGTGKTVLASLIVALEKEKDKDCEILFLVHRDRLISQTINKLVDVAGIDINDIGVVQGQRNQTNKKIVIASVPTLAREKRRKPLLERSWKLVIVDECHHSAATSWSSFLSEVETDFILGLTATPTRADGRDLTFVFGSILHRYTIKTAVEEKALVGIEGIRCVVNADFSKVPKLAGDFNSVALSKVLNKPSHNKHIFYTWKKKAGNKKTLIFAVDIAHCKDLTEMFVSKGISASYITSQEKAEEREQILADFENGKTQVLINRDIMTEGIDIPSVECIVLARVTRSSVLYIQMVGRGLRLHTGKEKCLVIDIAGNSNTHDVIQLGSLLGVENAYSEEELSPELLAERKAWEEECNRRRAQEKGSKELFEEEARAYLKNEFNWIKQCGVYFLPATDNGSYFVIKPINYDTNQWNVYLWKFTNSGDFSSRRLTETEYDLDTCMRITEKEVLPKLVQKSVAFVLKSASWRKKEVTQNQAEMMKRLKLDPLVPPLTCGEAADMISKEFFRLAIRNATPLSRAVLVNEPGAKKAKEKLLGYYNAKRLTLEDLAISNIEDLDSMPLKKVELTVNWIAKGFKTNGAISPCLV